MRSFAPPGIVKGRVLIAHVVEAVMVDAEEDLPTSHTHFREARAMVQVFLDLGYAVDFISFKNHTFQPERKYDIFLSARVHFDLIASRLDESCLKIVHLDIAHWAFNNAAALDRVLDVQRRRGVTIPSVRIFEMNRAIETADVATMVGNGATYETYAFADKTVFQVPNPAITLNPWEDRKDFEACRKSFLWIGSGGLVHKGLDLTLEAFVEMPEFELTVCGPVLDDAVFVSEFRRELFDFPNIRLVGWVDVTSSGFRELARRTVALVYPSCAEGSAGVVVNAMQFGLIPLISRESGVDIRPDLGLNFDSLTVASIQRSVRQLANVPAPDLERMSRDVWREARDHYTIDHFTRAFSSAIERTLDEYPDLLVPGFVPSAIDKK